MADILDLKDVRVKTQYTPSGFAGKFLGILDVQPIPDHTRYRHEYVAAYVWRPDDEKALYKIVPRGDSYAIHRAVYSSRFGAERRFGKIDRPEILWNDIMVEFRKAHTTPPWNEQDYAACRNYDDAVASGTQTYTYTEVEHVDTASWWSTPQGVACAIAVANIPWISLLF